MARPGMIKRLMIACILLGMFVGAFCTSLALAAAVDTVASGNAPAACGKENGECGKLLALHAWQEGWAGVLGAVAAAVAAAYTVAVTRRAAADQIQATKGAAKEQVEAADRQVEQAKTQMQQERLDRAIAELDAMDVNLAMHAEMVRSWRPAVEDLCSVNRLAIKTNAWNMIRPVVLPGTINLTTDQCSVLGISAEGMKALGDLINTGMRMDYGIGTAKGNGNFSPVLAHMDALPEILDRIEAAHAARRIEIADQRRRLQGKI